MNDRLNAGLPVDDSAAVQSKGMSDRLNSNVSTETPTVPMIWDADPSTQLRALRDEVIRQRDFPTAHTHAYMADALAALESLPPQYIPPERVEALIQISRFYYLDGEVEQTVQTAEFAVRAAVLGGHRVLEAQARARYAISLRGKYDFFGSMTELTRALELAREDGDAEGEAKILNSLGNSYSDAGLQTEALAVFEQVAKYFEANGDLVSTWMALDNAALAALRQGDIERGTRLAARAKAAWSGEARTANERLWVVQGALTNCQLLIQADRADEAAELAQAAKVVGAGLEGAKTLVALADAITAFSSGAVRSDAIERVIAHARARTPNEYWVVLDASIRTYERAGEFDAALSLQRELLEFNKKQKFEEVRRALGRSSPEEVDGPAKIAQLGAVVDRRITELVNAAVNQSLRAGYDHARIFRVGRLAELFATAEGWSFERAQSIALAAKLIDLGMMVIGNEVLNRPRDLFVGERALVEEHVTFGAELLVNTRLGLLEKCVPVVRFHHERWDGTGPSKLKGDAIPIEARLVALCDSFDALTHDRPWRRAFSIQAALRAIDDGAGTRFDPDLATTFVSWMQTEFWKTDDLETHLGADAMENDYVRMRKRIEQVIGTAA
jgi:HD-GYP domain-containing protein (c-di-GMP phosphodiesterase class II)